MEVPRLLLISGWGFPPSIWDRTLEQLGPGCDCRVFDPVELLRPRTLAEIERGVADTLRPQLSHNQPCFLGGWSLGGMLALQSARHLAPHIHGLLLIASTPQFCRSEHQRWGASPAEVRAMRSGLRRRPEGTLESFYRQAASPSETAWRGYRPFIPQALRDLDGLCRGLDYLLAANLHRRPLNSGLPVMLLHGRDDQVVPYTGSRSLAAQLQPSRFDMIVEAGHDLPLRRPELLRAAIHRLQCLCL